MDASAWIALGGLAFVMLVQAGATIWWAASINARVTALQEQARGHGELRDIVIEMRTEMRGFQSAIKELAEGLKDTRRARAGNAQGS